MSVPVIRKWQATIARDDVAAWKETFERRVLPNMRAVDGFRGITVLTERGGEPCRMTVLTAWEDMEAVQRFAGENPARTVMPDFMAPFFPTYDAEASFHDEIMAEASI
ncbi:antibiotic biosynthesis monooxygenase [Ruegeria jejuensis]|uniref:antibiotic biosynthesis monooxygenase n=1 Tax=Ruegeria jejuensis TaxID=3233338 RepID=UPI00355B11D3